ncbi:MAG: hypothetical protein ABJB16_14495 [Saprospiraceae bacterium]
MKEPLLNEVENGYLPAIESDRMNVKDYVHWVQDNRNGFRKDLDLGVFTFSAQFKPYEYIICLEEHAEEIADSLMIRKIQELNGMQYYDLRIKLNGSNGELLKHNLSSEQEYSNRVSYFSFEMQNDIHLVEGTDTLTCALYHFERTFDVSPTSTILLGFPVSNKNSSEIKTLLVYDRTFNNGLMKFTFSKKDLMHLPKLKTI